MTGCLTPAAKGDWFTLFFNLLKPKRLRNSSNVHDVIRTEPWLARKHFSESVSTLSIVVPRPTSPTLRAMNDFKYVKIWMVTMDLAA
jgi:hypothetical protein